MGKKKAYKLSWGLSVCYLGCLKFSKQPCCSVQVTRLEGGYLLRRSRALGAVCAGVLNSDFGKISCVP